MEINKITIEGRFIDFDSFSDKCLSPLYMEIISSLEKMIENNEEEVKILVTAKIGPVNTETEFVYSRKDKKLINDFILPYYEEIEDYMTCNRIKKLNDSL